MTGFYGLALEVHNFFSYSIGQRSVRGTKELQGILGDVVGYVPRTKR